MAKRSLLFFCIFLSTFSIWAQNTLRTQVAKDSKGFLPENLSLALVQELEGNNQKDLEGERRIQSLSLLSLSYELDKQDSLQLVAAYTSRPNQSEEGGEFLNTSITWLSKANRLYGEKFLTYRHGFSSYLPTSASDREDTSFRSAITYRPRITLDFSEIALPLQLDYRPSLRRNFHRFTTDAFSQFNVEYSFANRLLTTYQLSEKWLLNLDLNYIVNRTYNSVDTTQFQIAESLIWNWNQNWSIAIGHRNGGSSLRADGSSNIGLYDAIQSQYFTYFEFLM